jgi:hypothetical protein
MLLNLQRRKITQTPRSFPSSNNNISPKISTKLYHIPSVQKVSPLRTFQSKISKNSISWTKPLWTSKPISWTISKSFSSKSQEDLSDSYHQDQGNHHDTREVPKERSTTTLDENGSKWMWMLPVCVAIAGRIFEVSADHVLEISLCYLTV